MTNPGRSVVRIATRASRLAIWQARHVATCLEAIDPDVVVELVEVSTVGDRDRARGLDAMGGTGVFTREIQQAVLDDRADLAVHSLKDLPTDPVEGLVLAAVPERGDPGDALIVGGRTVVPPESSDAGLGVIDQGARVGTGSPRRKAQLKHRRPDLDVVGVRGNVETRLRKLDEGEYDVVVLAVAGLVRLQLAERITTVLDPADVLPAVGQGALGLECRADDESTADRLATIDDATTHASVTAERAMLARLRAGCHAPVGVQSGRRGDRLWLRGVVLDPEGTCRVEAERTSDPGTAATVAENLGTAVADELLGRGAAELIG